MKLGYLTDAKNAERHRLKQQAGDANKKARRRKCAKAVKPAKNAKTPAAPKKPKKLIVYKAEIVPYEPGLGANFYQTREWQILRYKAFKAHGRTCIVCGARDTELHVDHIKPRSKYPELELDLTNLQIMCRACNLGKGNSDTIDWKATTL